MKLTNLTQTLFWLRRHRNQVAARGTAPTSEELAQRGVPYKDRAAILAECATAAKAAEAELKSFDEAITFIETIAPHYTREARIPQDDDEARRLCNLSTHDLARPSTPPSELAIAGYLLRKLGEE